MSPSPILSSHQPVMVDQVLGLLLQSNPAGGDLDGIVVDGTVGGAGHAAAILDRLSPSGRLVCLDRDPDALKRAGRRLESDPRVSFHQASYAEVESYLSPESAWAVLLDLGLSSDQLEAERGFSFGRDASLDMRFDPRDEITAYDVVNKYSIPRLREVFFKYGEEPLSPRIARRIAEARKVGAIGGTLDLVRIIEASVPERFRTKAAARIFQAIRIEVNREIEHLERGLEACWTILKPGGVLCCIAYHSIEDRRIKRFIAEKVKGCICPPRIPVCVCGKKPSARSLTPAALRPSAREIRLNPRSRSARLRAALKLEAD